MDACAMTPHEFRAWRRRHDLSRAALLDALRRLGWVDLTIHALNTWGTRGVPLYVALILAFMERHPEDWRPKAGD